MSRNWAGTYEYTAPRIVAASTVDEVRSAVAAAVASGGRVHALGTRHSFTDLPDTNGTLIDLAGLEGGLALDEEARTVTVAAGTRYGVLALWLEERGWALHNLGSLPHISVGGATATGTHGSGDGNGVLSTAVAAFRYVGADGEVHDVRRGDPDFAALVVGLGAFGIVVSLTLDLQPSFRVRQDIYRGLQWDALLDRFDEVTGAGYSVSVFTRWEDDEVGHVWVKTRLDTDDDPVPDDLAGSVRDQVVGEALTPVLDTNVTEQGGVPGPWLLRLPHFRLEAQPSYGDEIQTEYFVPREQGPEALRAVKALAASVQPYLLVTELRTAAADELWLSGAYQRDFLAIHFTWMRDAEGVGSVIPLIEAALEPFGARPHWGKFHGFRAAEMERVHPRLADARAVYERLDPDGCFTNAHLERVGVRAPRG
ncbi:FAD-binding protein [Microbacterium rhizomatis]|uniref:FAD-binding protein n=1 Tax=Microbacterium rhizomatis TaxID=1631477 RepID=A0A5J5J0G3_9MICO|nr:FAD-binding protein [Microbacterium rhizomatis]KAA9108132.1 FAD-binding protein [Microbacterium rhizomatis]